ncbi:hypothetical protein [Streptomyces sp. NPDC060031]|uniref:hypothetical protein n=1 Tax=Streptomyces sp. NPDC060031 TaxID=3347043 RepID=UPI003684CD4B
MRNADGFGDPGDAVLDGEPGRLAVAAQGRQRGLLDDVVEELLPIELDPNRFPDGSIRHPKAESAVPKKPFSGRPKGRSRPFARSGSRT